MKGILLQYDADGTALEPVIRNGSLCTADTLRQNQALLLMLHKGELKENPAVGIGISDMLLDWRTMIKEQLEMDGQRVSGVRLTTTGIEIKATY